MKHLIANVRLRGLDRLTFAYAVAAWATVQGAALAAGAFAWRPWILQAIIVVALLGLPAVLLSGWAIAVRKTSGSVLRPDKGDLAVLAVIGGVSVVATAFTAVMFWPGLRDQSDRAAELGAPPASLAVLPFANVGGDRSKQYFSDGLSDELINALSRVRSLRVAARSSSFAFAGKAQDARTIAQVLNVRALLEGSVREAGNRVRITAQLVNGADGFQMWSESYDRELTDVLAVQDDIARSVTSALTAKLIGKPRHLPSVDPEAYRLFLQGKFYVARGNKDDLQKALSLLKEASLRAPEFADARAMLGNAEVLLAYNYSENNGLPDAERSLKAALEVDPKNVTALKAMVDLSTVRWRWREVLEYAERLLVQNPTSYESLIVRSGVADLFGFTDESSKADLAASKLDPLSFVGKFNVAAGYRWARKYEEAAEYIHAALLLSPADPDARNLECLIEVDLGKLARARELSALLPKAGGDQNTLGCSFNLAIAERKMELARAMVERAAATVSANGGSNTDIGDSYLKLGDFEHAITWYRRAYQARERSLLNVPKLALPEQRAFFNRADWKALWNMPPIREWEAARPEAARVLRLQS